MWLDESGINANERYDYGYAPKGERLYSLKPGSRGQRISIIGALRDGNIIASMVYDGYCNSEVFDLYIRECLVPELKAGQTIILDNVSFHYSKDAKQMIEAAGCSLKFLPIYSPDLNLIEYKWYPLKNAAKKLMGNGVNIQEALMKTLVNMSG